MGSVQKRPKAKVDLKTVKKYFTEFQIRRSYTSRKKYSRLCKVTGKIPGKSGDPKLETNE